MGIMKIFEYSKDKRHLDEMIPNDILFWVDSRFVRHWYKMTHNHGNEILDSQIEQWLTDHGVRYPFENDEDRLLFELVWG